MSGSNSIDHSRSPLGDGPFALGRIEIVKKSIKNDPNFALPRLVVDDRNADINALLKADVELTEKLHAYKELRIIGGLLKEFYVNLELWELESCFYSLRNIHQKLQKNILAGQSRQFKQSVNDSVDHLHFQLIERVRDALDGFWKFGKDSITFRSSFTTESGDNEILYNEISECVKSHLFEDAVLGSNSSCWFVSSIESIATKNVVIQELSAISDKYLKHEQTILFFKKFLFSSDIVLFLEGSCIISERRTRTIDLTLDSFQNLATFLSGIVSAKDADLILQSIGNLLVNEIIKFVRQEAAQLLIVSQQRQRLIDINAAMADLSLNTAVHWCYDRSKLDVLLADEKIIIDLKLDQILHDELLKLRAIFESDNWRLPMLVENRENKCLPESKPEQEQDDDLDDEWAWNDDEAEKDDKDHVKEDVDDGWGEEIALDLEIDPLPKNDAKYFQTKREAHSKNESLMITRMPQGFKQTLINFEKGCDALGRNQISATYHYKLQLLLTSFMAMCMCKYTEWWQLYNDITVVISECSPKINLFRLHELNERFVRTHIENMKITAQQLIFRQLNEFSSEENRPQWEFTKKKLLPFVQESVIPSLLRLVNGGNRLSEFLDFTYNECLIQKVLSWDVISEKNSENIAKLINIIAAGTSVKELRDNPQHEHLRERLVITGKVVNAHLTDIMTMFSDGDFYLFTTDEIIQWIVKLFADTGLRRECIDEIRDVREENRL
ncbi:LAMI_0F02520g1_1 [Lachancea mirantina]|uniref:LAMI_0F02520g1_1 n=1 Tax=Lachancea mirantina TaxID=1230905 RepID=A0A1G4JWI2_9SACH|nr:LAMI_0F02520g1_1 [Lachancea mirantina]